MSNSNHFPPAPPIGPSTVLQPYNYAQTARTPAGFAANQSNAALPDWKTNKRWLDNDRYEKLVKLEKKHDRDEQVNEVADFISKHVLPGILDRHREQIGKEVSNLLNDYIESVDKTNERLLDLERSVRDLQLKARKFENVVLRKPIAAPRQPVHSSLEEEVEDESEDKSNDVIPSTRTDSILDRRPAPQERKAVMMAQFVELGFPKEFAADLAGKRIKELSKKTFMTELLSSLSLIALRKAYVTIFKEKPGCISRNTLTEKLLPPVMKIVKGA